MEVDIHTIVPTLPNSEAVVIAVVMIGARVMLDVIYLPLQLVQSRNTDFSDEGKLIHLRIENIDVALVMNIAFIVNAVMVVVSAGVFYKNGMVADSMEQAHSSLSLY